MLFADLAATSAAVTETSSRRAKVRLLAGALRRLAGTGDPREIEAGSAYLAGEMRQRQIGVGWASLRELPAPADVPALAVLELDARLAELASVSGAGSQARRRALLGHLFAALTAAEQKLLIGIISGEVRQGAQAGSLADAIASAAGVPISAVRRALLLVGDLRAVAVSALTGGEAALGEFGLRVGRPLAPMLAQAASSVDEALSATGTPAAVDAKLDGIRIQVHRDGDDVAVFSRSLDDITSRVPEIVAVARALRPTRAVLDGEALAVGPDGRARPFQETASRTSRLPPGSLATESGHHGGAGHGPSAQPAPAGVLTPFFFDALHVDGADLIDEPGRVRWAALDAAVPSDSRVARAMVTSPDAAREVFAAALEHGHEGVVVKAAESMYAVGRRGSAWVKVKPRHTLDLVVLAAEWGHGRRRGYLSNLHLGARDPAGGGFVMLGKTFKGLTDAMLAWQTDRLQGLAVHRGEWVVVVRPELVAEVAFDGVQKSSRYPGGVTLRFARVLRYREDKPAGQADTLDDVRALSPAAHRAEAPLATDITA